MSDSDLYWTETSERQLRQLATATHAGDLISMRAAHWLKREGYVLEYCGFWIITGFGLTYLVREGWLTP